MKVHNMAAILHEVDMSEWRFCSLYTIEQAALLFGGIDPAFTPTIEEAKRKYPEKYRKAFIALQAFRGGIVLKTLQVHELYLINNDSGYSYSANQEKDMFSILDIDTNMTLVQRMVLISWVNRNR